MRTFRLLTSSALLAGLCLAPLGAAETATDNAADGGREHRADQVQHGDKEHPDWPKLRACETDKERDALRDKLKGMAEKDRDAFLDKLHDFMEERRERLDHLCDLIKKHPHMSDERKQALLAIINDRREEIRNRMKEFFANRKARYEHHVELAKVTDKIEDLRGFIRNHPCLSDAQKDRLKDKLADLRDDRQEIGQEWREDHPAAGNPDKLANGGDNVGGSSAISDEQKAALAARMAAMKKEKVETRSEIRSDVQDIKEDRQDIHADRVELHQDYQDLKEDKADKNKVEVQSDLRDIHEDRKDLHQDQKELVTDHQDLREDLGKGPLSDEQKEKLKARIEQARQNRDGNATDGPGPGDRPQLSDEQKENLKARIEQARQNRDGDATAGPGPGDHPQLNEEQKAKLKARLEQARENRPNGPAERGNNGLGNGEDPQPRGDPKVNDGPGAGPGRPGARPAR